MQHYVCIHGHFYQPPRENPWLEEIELQDSAYPHHDWNSRITAECYGPNSASRIFDEAHHISNIVNNYEFISFNFGPTLLSWLEKHSPEVYNKILTADSNSMKRFSGHGTAIAQCYNHIIMPLANDRDKITQIIWGIKDFEYRFKRKPEGMWLPETAVDMKTLQILAENGIKYTILAQNQAKRIRKIGEKKWADVNGSNIDPKRPYLCRLGGEKKITIFFYDGPVSRSVAFSGILNNGENLAKKIMQILIDEPEYPQIANIATDGETYGHHHSYGDMALAYCLHYIESSEKVKLTIYGEFLDKYPAEYEVEIYDNSSWSCIHGVERWKSNCGCNSGMNGGWTQEWRAPLRNALDWLRDIIIPVFENKMEVYVKDPWHIRNEYIKVILDRSEENLKKFFKKYFAEDINTGDKIIILKLLEMQRQSMLMYTSCGWFFDEISGVETVQILNYAARAIQLAEEVSGQKFEEEFLNMLEKAPSNIYHVQNGRRTFEIYVKPSIVDLYRFAAHFVLSSFFKEYEENIMVYCYSAESTGYEKEEAGYKKFAAGHAKFRSSVTGEENHLEFAALYLGDLDFYCGVRDYIDENTFEVMSSEIKSAFHSGNLPKIFKLLGKHFEDRNYTLWHLFREEQRKMVRAIIKQKIKGTQLLYNQIYDQHYSLMNSLKNLNQPLPSILYKTAEFILNEKLKDLLKHDKLDYDEFENLVNEINKWHIKPYLKPISYAATCRINNIVNKLYKEGDNIEILKQFESEMKLFRKVPLKLNLWEAQNIYFSLSKGMYPLKLEMIKEKDDESAKEWVDCFRRLQEYLEVSLD